MGNPQMMLSCIFFYILYVFCGWLDFGWFCGSSGGKGKGAHTGHRVLEISEK